MMNVVRGQQTQWREQGMWEKNKNGSGHGVGVLCGRVQEGSILGEKIKWSAVLQECEIK